MEWECHTPPQGNFEINLAAALGAARDAGAESMMFYSQDHWGYAFYQSDVAVRHPPLEGGLHRQLPMLSMRSARRMSDPLVVNNPRVRSPYPLCDRR
jgi:hypothetical protein